MSDPTINETSPDESTDNDPLEKEEGEPETGPGRVITEEGAPPRKPGETITVP